eukprot:RCo014770
MPTLRAFFAVHRTTAALGRCGVTSWGGGDEGVIVLKKKSPTPHRPLAGCETLQLFSVLLSSSEVVFRGGSCLVSTAGTHPQKVEAIRKGMAKKRCRKVCGRDESRLAHLKMDDQRAFELHILVFFFFGPLL